MRILVLVDGEHYPSVVRAAIDRLPSRFPGTKVVAAALLGGSEKLMSAGATDQLEAELGIPVVTAGTGIGAGPGPVPDEALAAGLVLAQPDLVYDLSDEPVLDARVRMRLVARVLAAGVAYQGADFRFDPPPRPHLAARPSLAVIGTGKRTGKTAVTGQLARLLRQRGTPPVIVAMGRGGPATPELVDPATFDLSPEGLVALADSGRHAASDHLEDAVMSGAVAIGTRRCGGGMAGAPADDTFAEGVRMANSRPEPFLLFEGSGQAIPPVHADATVLVVPGSADPELVAGYLGGYRLLLADLIVITMAVTSLAASVPRANFERDIQRLLQGAAPRPRPIVRVTLRPTPLTSISGRRVFYATTAPASARAHLAAHLEHEHGAKVTGISHHLANRPLLLTDLEEAAEPEVLLVELKAAGVDLAARYALKRGIEVVFCDNRIETLGGDGTFDELSLAAADLAAERFSGTERVDG